MQLNYLKLIYMNYIPLQKYTNQGTNDEKWYLDSMWKRWVEHFFKKMNIQISYHFRRMPPFF